MSELAYERILAELRETRGVLDAQLRPTAQQIVQVEIDQLVNSARACQARLMRSSAEIDRCLDACQRHWTDMEHASDELAAINEQLLGFGQETAFRREEFLPSTRLVSSFLSRINKE